LARADAAARAQQEANALARQYGLGMQGYDPWAGGVETPGNVLNPSIQPNQATQPGSYFGMNVNPTYGEDFIGPPAPGYTGSTGAFYAGEQFGSPAEEYQYMQDLGPGGAQFYDMPEISVAPGSEWMYGGYWLD
jgi:hypothetical protein